MRLAKCLALLYCALYAPVTLADSDDTFNILFNTGLIYDDNVFRLPSGREPVAVGAERSDNILKTSIGFKINKKYSLQIFKFDFSHAETKYDNAKFLDFNANNYKAAWLWSLTPHLKGNISADRTVDLVPFIDNRNTNSQNKRVTEIQIADFDFSPHDVWHFLGGITRLEVLNSQAFLPETSFKFNAGELGLKYVFPSQSYVMLKVRNREGQNQSTNFAGFVGKGFNEKEEELTGLWILTDKSRLTTNIGHIDRADDTFNVRDYAGVFGGINYAWDITGKVNLNVSLNRKLSAFQDRGSSYTQNDTLVIKPTWGATSKIVVGANLQIGRRTFLGDGPVQGLPDREDKSFIYGIGVDWTPRSTIKIGLVFQHDARNSNVSGLDYQSNSAGLNGQLNF